ncbi:hypothetical protein KDL01_38730 [Actinospica durhamensis]|uniref:Protein-L-isoaspartate O-methyltransferase n=1 Tax=Actinospica durhamensis TaxID=1508375 RepID=A0A941IWF2_9ACTN|nr:hypothetical protein [Actinospica durhamensis]MBR7839261.1 hypothetical protein [Actinospica durhamensis]
MIDLEDEWQDAARRLAAMVELPDSPWFRPLATTPRHRFIPAWFERSADGWTSVDGDSEREKWRNIAYESTASIVTKVAGHHADLTDPQQPIQGRPTSSATNPWRVIQIYRAARIHNGCGDVLDVGTGPGYGAALLSKVVGSRQVTTIDVDAYLTRVAEMRLRPATDQPHPRIITADATGPLDWEGNRIAAMVSVPGIPASWLASLKPDGRLAVSIAGTSITIAARKLEDGGAWGRVELEPGGFMRTRGPGDYPPPLVGRITAEMTYSDEDASVSPYPVVNLDQAPELSSLLALTVPGIEWVHDTGADGAQSTWLAHPDGSWARAEGHQDFSTVRTFQGGPRRLWDELDRIRLDWLRNGRLSLFGAEVRIQPDGEATFSSGSLNLTFPGAQPSSS